MQWSIDASQIDWIRERMADLDGAPVASQVPRGFEAYARILHPILDSDGGRTRWKDVAKWSGSLLRPMSAFRSISHAHYAGEKEDADWPASPIEGTLEARDARALLADLSDHTEDRMHCWFAVWEGHGWVWGGGSSSDPVVNEAMKDPVVPSEIRDAPRAWIPHRAFILYYGDLEDFFALQKLRHVSIFGEELPNLWWPEDRAWCVATDIDTTSTYVGGPSKLISQLVSNPELEAFAVGPDDQLLG